MELTRDNAKTELLKFRGERELTQEELAKKAGIAIGTIIAIENGTKKPQALTLSKLNKCISLFFQ